MNVENAYGVPNQFIIHDDNGNTYFQSYDSLIVKRDRNGQVWLSDRWNYSVTTSKYRARFLGEDTKTTERKIKSGQYVVVDDLSKTEDRMAGGGYLTDRLDAEWNRYMERIYAIAEAVFEGKIKPFCREHNLHFMSGNGDWILWGEAYPNRAEEEDIRSMEGGDEIYDFLDTEVEGLPGNDLGSLMPSGEV